MCQSLWLSLSLQVYIKSAGLEQKDGPDSLTVYVIDDVLSKAGLVAPLNAETLPQQAAKLISYGENTTVRR